VSVIAVIGGTGPQGRGLGDRFARGGHEVVLGSRGQERAGVPVAASGPLNAGPASDPAVVAASVAPNNGRVCETSSVPVDLQPGITIAPGSDLGLTFDSEKSGQYLFVKLCLPKGQTRHVLAEARNLLGGSGILLEHHVIRHMAAIEAVYTFEGTDTIQTPIVGRDITEVSAFARTSVRKAVKELAK
jgi:NAD(P)-dependent dehydrogenase (short-subunit alcohol dehydrogenase family)